MRRDSHLRRPATPLDIPDLADLPRFMELLEARTLFSSATPNDPLYSSQYALADAQVAGAWATTTGDATVTVADIDTGADYTHEDLYENVWINQAEIPEFLWGHLVDVDNDTIITFYDLNDAANRSLMTDVNGNGYIDGGDLLNPVSEGGWEDGINGALDTTDVYTDDLIGWDFAENDNNPYDDGTANASHGTHTAGIIGATGDNGVGISGVVQKTSLMIVRIFDDQGNAIDDSTLAAAVRYTANGNAAVANASWGGSGGQNGDALYQAIAYAGTKGEVFVTAAGNDGQNLDSAWYNDWPAEYALDNIIVVGALNDSGSLAYYSNYGSTTVDVLAPGSNVLSTLPGNQYGEMSGTSMATPMVTGTVALMLAANPGLTIAQVKEQLIDGSDESSTLANRSVSDGAISTANAVLALSGADLADGSDGTGNGGGGTVITLPPGFFFGAPGGGFAFIGSSSGTAAGSPFNSATRIGASEFFG